ncbi:MAG: Fic family protein [Pseudomonadales bacterium]|nr:Fic family protein [Pseudomonadales bacterium]
MANLLFSSDITTAEASKRIKKGELTRIRNGIYVDTQNNEEIIKTLNNKWMEVACFISNQSVAIARTAATLLPADNHIYLESGELKKRRTTLVGHLKFDISPGNSLDGIEPITMRFKRSNLARYCLENLAQSRGPASKRKTLGTDWVETELVKIIRKRGEQGLNTLRDEAKELAPKLGLEKEFEKLNKILSSLLQTHSANGILQTRLGVAEAKGEPYDAHRLDVFSAYKNYLLITQLETLNYTYNSASWRNLTFFESYFSNFIEGTEFTLDEAEEIAFEKKVNYERHEDSHDILAHIDISGDPAEMYKTPASSDELIHIMKVRHSILLAERPDKRPGQFKEKANKAGATDFVLPEYLEGTLVQGYEIYESLNKGLDRALFMHFLISECHPFDDGNGRLSRIMMNAELVSEDQHKIIIPIVHRESYLNGMRAATREAKFRTMTKVLHQLHCYTASINWLDYGDARQMLQDNAADQDPNEGVAIFNKTLSKLGGNYPAG